MHFQVFVSIYVFLAATCTVKRAYTGTRQGNDILDLTAFEVDGSAETPFTFQAAVETSVEKRNVLTRKRIKRALSLIDKGIVAAKVLLNGARQLKSKSRQWKRYEKPGSLATAVREFYKLKPTNVKRHDLPNGVRVLEGTVGDRIIYIKTRDPLEKGNPTTELFDPKRLNQGYKYSIQEQPSDKIIYKKDLLKQ